LTEEERVKEDMAYLAKKAKEEQALKSGGTVEKYHHKGAFFMVGVFFNYYMQRFRRIGRKSRGMTFTHIAIASLF